MTPAAPGDALVAVLRGVAESNARVRVSVTFSKQVCVGRVRHVRGAFDLVNGAGTVYDVNLANVARIETVRGKHLLWSRPELRGPRLPAMDGNPPCCPCWGERAVPCPCPCHAAVRAEAGAVLVSADVSILTPEQAAWLGMELHRAASEVSGSTRAAVVRASQDAAPGSYAPAWLAVRLCRHNVEEVTAIYVHRATAAEGPWPRRDMADPAWLACYGTWTVATRPSDGEEVAVFSPANGTPEWWVVPTECDATAGMVMPGYVVVSPAAQAALVARGEVPRGVFASPMVALEECMMRFRSEVLGHAPRPFAPRAAPATDGAWQAATALVRAVGAMLDHDGTVPATFGPYLAGLRRARGLTLRDAARALGLSNGYLSQIETGARSPAVTWPFLRKIAETFDRPIAEVRAEAAVPACDAAVTALRDALAAWERA